MTLSDKIQISIAISTFVAAFAAMFATPFWRWLHRPRIVIDFNPDDDRCKRGAIVPDDVIQDEKILDLTVRTFFRLRMTNLGGPAVGVKTHIDIKDKDGRPLDRFDPSPLNWVGGGPIKKDIARGEMAYLDVASIAHDIRIQNRTRFELQNKIPRGIAWDRELGKYMLLIYVYGDNLRPISEKWLLDTGDGDEQSGKFYKVS